jgi:hypothetical protein
MTDINKLAQAITAASTPPSGSKSSATEEEDDMGPQAYRMPGGTPRLGQDYQMPDRVYERRGTEEGYDTPPGKMIPQPSQRPGYSEPSDRVIKPDDSPRGNKDFVTPIQHHYKVHSI